MTRVFFGLGANLGDPATQMADAVESLARLPETRIGAKSPLYRTAPIGLEDQPEFTNAVCSASSGLSAPDLLTAIRKIEADHGRSREVRWGPRTLDIDILLYGDARIATRDLQIPHPRLQERRFVLVPLADLAPTLRVPGLGHSVATLLMRCKDPSEVHRLDPQPRRWELAGTAK